MKCKHLFVLGAVLVFLWTVFGGAVHAADKIGFVNLRKVMNSSDAGKKLTKKLNQSMEKDRAAILEQDKELKKLKEEIDQQGSKWKAKKIKEKKITFEKKFQIFQISLNEFNVRVRQKEQEIVEKLMPKILEVVAKIAKKEEYTMVVDPQLSQLAFFSPGSDLTKRVLQEFDKSYQDQ